MAKKRIHSSCYYAARIALIYIVIAGLWILLSDRIVDSCVSNEYIRSSIQTAKGWLFVLVTGVLLLFERYLSYRKLCRSELRVENYFNYSLDGIVLTNTAGIVTVWNPSMERIFGISPSAAVGTPVWEIAGIFALKDMDGRTGNALAERMLRTGSPVILRGSDDYLLADHTVIHVSQTLFTIPEKKGFLIGGFYRDETMSKKNERERESLLELKDILIREIHHRVKNNLQMMTSLLHLQERSATDDGAKKVLADSRDRIRSMAMIHECLYKTGDYSFVQFDDYVKRLISGISGTYNSSEKKVNFVTDIEDILMKASSAVPCALLLNELFTNIYKHVAVDGKDVEVQVIIRHVEEQCYIQVRDNGQGLPPDLNIQESKSLGLGLIKTFSQQLGGEPVFRNSDGLIFELRFPDNGIVSGTK
jgi:PAS domain S-box-containing protein